MKSEITIPEGVSISYMFVDPRKVSRVVILGSVDTLRVDGGTLESLCLGENATLGTLIDMVYRNGLSGAALQADARVVLAINKEKADA